MPKGGGARVERAQVWFQEGFGAAGGGGGWIFSAPRRVVAVQRTEDVCAALAEIRAATAVGLWAAGFVGYEAAPAFDRALAACAVPAGAAPLLWFGIFDGPRPAVLRPAAGTEPLAWEPSLAAADYARRVGRIRELIAAGDVYQVNFTYPLAAAAPADPLVFWRGLVDPAHGRYGAYLDIGSHAIVSFSPELFFRQEGDAVETCPMKGTAARGRWPDEDARRAAALVASEKERAENLMIVDLLRNDLGRVAAPGSVAVADLFRVERYRTVWQMTSTIAARTAAHPVETLAALFPCGSVTGAPKVRAMQIIAELEGRPRGVYTGAIGWFGPGRRACFSVAIRTIEIDRSAGAARYGVGGGITWDSRPEAEWEETRRKAALLGAAPDRFDLFETLRWTPGEGWFLIGRHLARLRESAGFFGFPYDPAEAGRLLERTWPGPRRARLVLRRDGRMTLEARPLDAPPQTPWRVALARGPIDGEDARLCHKTTWREPYEQARAGRPGFDDVLLFNARGELTESTIANVVVERGGRLLSPARDGGLLAGTLRAELLESGRIAEAVIAADSLRPGERLWLINAVRGWVEARLDA